MSENSCKRKYIIIFWSLFALPFLILALMITLVATGRFGYMPDFKELENPQRNIASELITADNKVLGNYYNENRTFVRYEDLSPYLEQALVATEDIRFYNHSGIDGRSLIRVALKTILMGQSSAGGGSTITQQLAKNLFPRDTTLQSRRIAQKLNLVRNKFKEWVTAVKLERNYTKKEILLMYYNTVPFGHLSFGIKSASHTFFNKTPDSLTIEEAAVLVGLLKAPTRYSPVLNPENAISRRNIVLGQMMKYKYITPEEFDSLTNMPINLDYRVQDHNVGHGTYFREYLRIILTAKKPERKMYRSYKSYQEDSIDWVTNPLFGWCNKNIKPDGTPYDLYRDGLKIYTPVNYTMQKYAEEAVKEHLGGYLQDLFFREMKGYSKAPFSKELTKKEIDKIMQGAVQSSDRYRLLRLRGISKDSIMEVFNTPAEMKVFSWEGEKDTVMTPLDSIKYIKHFLHAGFIALNPINGEIKAYVGGINFRIFKYDHVKIGRRQVGSTIKPFLYTLAYQEGYKPCDKVPNVPVIFQVNDSTWSPRNAGLEEYEGKMVTLKWGLANSVNYISAWVMKQFNPQSVIKIMRDMGVESYIDPVPSMVLGTPDISLYEIVSAYGTFANKGIHTSPLFVKRIEDKNGNVISTFKPQKAEVINEVTAYLMIESLKTVVDQGTAGRLRYVYEFENEIAGKTGTTQNYSDGWFVGITPDLVGGAWVGGKQRSIHFDSNLGYGSNMALPIYGIFMKKVLSDSTLNVSKEPFERPDGFNVNLDCDEPDIGGSSDDYDIFSPY
ncbi:MAG: transglycosylase domain-containing protein [Bacteroidota bacterium]